MTTSGPNIAIFASGAGTNAGKIIAHFGQTQTAKIALVVSGNPGAGVLKIASQHQIPVHLIEKQSFTNETGILQTLTAYSIHNIVLAGFLWKLPPYLVHAFPGKIINIHPALLPKFGGAGMYGKRVFEAVYAARETESGITIHEVDEWYDHGAPLFQARFPILPADTPETIAQKTQELEHRHLPAVTEQWALGLPVTG